MRIAGRERCRCHHLPDTAQRAVALAAFGVIDTLTATFGMLIAVRVFHMSDVAKSVFLSATSGGMVASLFVVPLLLRAKSTIARTAAKVQILGGACMAVSASFPHDATLYVAGLSLGLFCLSMHC